MKDSRKLIGKQGEQMAREYLEAHGYRIILANYHTPHGEIDIVAQYEDMLVFIEVKARTSHTLGYPEDAVTAKKKVNLLSAIQFYLEKHGAPQTWQVDVLAVEIYRDAQPPRITHFENVFA